MPQQTATGQSSPPAFVPIKRAAELVGVHYRVLLEKVSDGTIPHYRLGRSRKLVRISQVIDAMQVTGDEND